MKVTQPEKPTILIPFKPAGCEAQCQDVFLYLRPESNGIEVESRIMRVIQEDPALKSSVDLAYLANFPGSFVLDKDIIHRHYHLKVYFAHKGLNAFTPHMKSMFTEHFGTEPEKARVLGAFEAIDTLGMNPDELFRLWVADEDLLLICGQNIKHWDGYFIVNYDIPAILSRNSINTDIAVMVFRTSLCYRDIHTMVMAIGRELTRTGLLRKDMPLSRVFHYSKGPFEQILDGAGYLFQSDSSRVPLENTSFYRYLAETHRFSDAEIRMAVNRPIMRFSGKGKEVIEDDIITFTQNDDFPSAADKFRRVDSQVLLPFDSEAPLCVTAV